MLIKTVRGFTPSFGERCFIAENATLIGDLIMGNDCSIWYQAVIRGDVNTIIGNKVSIGHNAIVHGCTIGDNVLVGMGSIIMDHSIVGSNSIIAAGAVVTKNTIISPGSIYAGIPAQIIKKIDPNLHGNEIKRIAQNYLKYASWFK